MILGLSAGQSSLDIVEINVHDIREYATDKHKMVDDRPFGGGDGMVLKPEPIFAAIENLLGTRIATNIRRERESCCCRRKGKPLKQAVAKEFADDAEHLVVDLRPLRGRRRTRERDARHGRDLDRRLCPVGRRTGGGRVGRHYRQAFAGCAGQRDSAENDSFSDGLLDCPHYTRPAEFRGMKVPDVLLNGNHAEIEKWRREKALEKTKLNQKGSIRRRKW